MSFKVKGWCPGALRPMASGDGLVLRIRARNGRLEPWQAQAIADLSWSHGNGMMDLTSRANLQLRGLDARGHGKATAALARLGLLDDSPEAEARRNVILSPFAPLGGAAWQAAETIARAMTAPDAPPVPGKFGFAVDADPPVLAGTPADIRLRPQGPGWLVLPDGGDWALPARNAAQAAARAVELARWFTQGGVRDGRGRMRDHLRHAPDPAPGATPLPPSLLCKYPCDSATGTAGADPAGPGPAPNGWLLGFAFGQITARQLAEAAALGPLRLTPWRALLIEGASRPHIGGAILDPGDPLLRIHACTGAPGCPQALANVRALARSLAPRLAPGQSLHVSGCAKGCACQGAASVTLVATGPDRFDLIRNGRPRDAAALAGLAPDRIPPLLR
ncbi:precorrin-3B synthase [Paracoccus sp. PS-1]|uniref:precorrin-3B synthase n=1 Tax=unclassified Paracoccus (in: a-proteobacteria) TaxID=2688777 RepID=UPI000491B935|nr:MULTISPECIES: precorrin-3B synthase [unclassified Paracoccus (in: a-proteobacteria)]MDQ7260254.1 precorrin-3B synthase [Paracoccus sp. PS1]